MILEMLEDMIGEVKLATVAIVAVLLAIWAFNVHEDRENAQEVRLAIIDACGQIESSESFDACVERIENNT